MINAITNLELNFVGEDLTFEDACKNIENQTKNLTEEVAYQNALNNLKNCKGQTLLTFSIFPKSTTKAFENCGNCGIIIFDTANQKLEEFEDFVQNNKNQKIVLGSTSLKKNLLTNLDEVILLVQKYKCKFVLRLCEDLFSAGEFCGHLKQNSEVMFALDCGLFDYGGAVVGTSLIDKEEVSALAQKNISLICSPTATLLRGYSFPQLYSQIQKGAKICIGTDNLFSNTFDISAEINLARLLCKSFMSDPTLFSQKEFFELCQDNAKSFWE